MNKTLAKDLLVIAEREIPPEKRKAVLEVSPFTTNLAYRCDDGEFLRNKISAICKAHPQWNEITTSEAVWVAWKLGLIIPDTMWDFEKVFGEAQS